MFRGLIISDITSRGIHEHVLLVGMIDYKLPHGLRMRLKLMSHVVIFASCELVDDGLDELRVSWPTS